MAATTTTLAPSSLSVGLSRIGAEDLRIYGRLAARGLVDSVAWVVALAFAVVARFDFDPAALGWVSLPYAVLVAVQLQLLIGVLLRLYRRRYAYGSFEEVRSLAATVGLTTIGLLMAAVLPWGTRAVPLSTPIVAGLAALSMMMAARYAWRLTGERRRPVAVSAAERVVVFGAGDAGRSVVRSMLHTPSCGYRPVALLDDNPGLLNRVVDGVPVMGSLGSIGAVARRTRATAVVFAIPSAGPALLRDVTARADRLGLKVKVLPPVAELIDGQVGVRDVRDLDLEDLLGRRALNLDNDSIAHYITGRRVLVTGAGGSIGSELCRQLTRFAPAELMMLDRDESGLHAAQLSLDGRGLLDSSDLILADIRDAARMTAIFTERRPEVVFHAAALKHLTLLENHPDEAVKTNVFGTLNVLEASCAAGVQRFVNISTDKAADPQCVLGYSKRITERLTADFARRCEGVYVSVRFGNVLGSRGSVLHAFAAQIAAGGPVTITDPDVTRFFMLIPEACQLVVQAGAIGRPGEVLVLDMGEPVRIADLAKRLVAQAPRHIDIVYTGLRPGEKLHEDLLGQEEVETATAHPLVSAVDVPRWEPVSTASLNSRCAEALIKKLRRAAFDPEVRCHQTLMVTSS